MQNITLRSVWQIICAVQCKSFGIVVLLKTRNAWKLTFMVLCSHWQKNGTVKTDYKTCSANPPAFVCPHGSKTFFFLLNSMWFLNPNFSRLQNFIYFQV